MQKTLEIMAEREGFEPPDPCGSTVFKTGNATLENQGLENNYLSLMANDDSRLIHRDHNKSSSCDQIVTRFDIRELSLKWYLLAFLLFSVWVLSACGTSGNSNTAQPLTCQSGYAKVEPLAPYTDTAFCIAQYEARKGETGLPVFKSDGEPWHLPRDPAQAACESIGQRLPTNAEWQAVARQAEAVAANWSGGKAGKGNLSQGLTFLPNGGMLYNLGNGVWEQVSGDLKGEPGYAEWIYRITDKTHPSVVSVAGVSGTAKDHFGPAGDYALYSYDPGLGLMNRRWSPSIMRGGDDEEPGIFGAALNHGPTDESGDVGFRCVEA